ncbi:helix-turn-helix domain-containing protein [Alkaliphilus sp. B6464]|uniref:helix-turn-helix domain-containing protein n=1 Tax=Alkaliphilus sp. B6464 TaxID=2731219 RepID=UPI001BAA3875|nr:helix-turn-helix domain-containing protein [Alkaliphilus sp. B6464]QUH19526.1 helix-turn-helix domain-containing protein [Alkaliphilus sp. B6464]
MEDRELRKVFHNAQNGDKDSIQKILEMFQPLVHKNSFIDGKFDEDCFQELNIKLINCIKSFEFSPIPVEDVYKAFEELLSYKE